MDIDRTVLDTERPGDAMSSILLSLSEVQEVIIHETRKLAAPGQRNQMDTARLGSLKQQMKYIRAQAQEVSFSCCVKWQTTFLAWTNEQSIEQNRNQRTIPTCNSNG
jgi:hypothetical protein